SILCATPDRSVVLVDIPRSIEEAQVALRQPVPHRRLLSSEPQALPWTLPEPKAPREGIPGASSNAHSASATIAELMTLEIALAALENVRTCHNGGQWCLPRAVSRELDTSAQSRGPWPSIFVPEASHHITGTIQDTRDELLMKTASVKFDLVLLDPPWPSRSARRKKSGTNYATVSNMAEARQLITAVPVASRLAAGGLVAVWITNKPAVYDLLVGAGGVFSQWGVELVGEWIWLKVTSTGQPVFNMHSQWRKPWERLLLARPRNPNPGGSLLGGSSSNIGQDRPRKQRSVQTKVILAVPDLHSRKPNLRGLLQDLLPPDYLGLEVFARHLTAGWWAWGNEPLLFQKGEHWVE
ncbi:MT-A70-domain-containing protein, partial [Microdochium trichocladiopsis]